MWDFAKWACPHSPRGQSHAGCQALQVTRSSPWPRVKIPPKRTNRLCSHTCCYHNIFTDRGKSQSRRIELTGLDFRDEVTRRDGTAGLTKLVDGYTTWMERWGDGQTLLSEQVKRRRFVEATCHPYGTYMAPTWYG